MRRVLPGLLLCSLLFAKHADLPGCGTHAARTRQELFLHQRSKLGSFGKRVAAARAANRDLGNIAVIDDSDGVVARRNPFTLDGKALAFVPSGAGKYTLRNDAPAFDATNAGTALAGIADDDTYSLNLPFAFPFFGATYSTLWINSNGNLTFTTGDGETGDYSLGRLLGGPPRIAPLFTDLDPSAARQGAIRVSATATVAVITWDRVPLYSDYDNGAEQSFQVRLYPSGQIEFAYSGVTATDAVTGIAPGSLKGTLSLIPFVAGSTAEFSGPVAEVFAGNDAVDVAAAAQKFFTTHDDAYDYLAIFNAVGVDAGVSALAYEVTVRNHRSGYGDGPIEIGGEFGSGSRLQSVLNLGPLLQYPTSPTSIVSLRRPAGDTPLTIIGHEAGHLFLAYASVTDPNNPNVYPMLGRGNVHWAFTFNSEASLLEGNRIQDNGAAASPRFTTIKTVEGYSPLDQYLMGFIPPAGVPATFAVTGTGIDPGRIPQTGLSFNGSRRDITIDDLIAVTGRRTPDSTVAQRRFRMAFILIQSAGTEPSAANLAQIDGYRTAFESFFAKASGNHAIVDTALARAVHVSAWPASGVVQGATIPVTVRLDAPAPSAATFNITRQFGLADVPATVAIAAGQSTATFNVKGMAPGVEELTLAADGYETVAARIQVRAAVTDLRLELVSGNNVFRVADVNELPYAGITVVAVINGATTRLTTGPDGRATFAYPPDAGGTIAIEGSPNSTITIRGASTSPIAAITNAASYAVGLTPNAHSTIFGSGLAQVVDVHVDGVQAAISYTSDTQLNFLAPRTLASGTAAVVVSTPWFTSGEFRVPVVPVSPGIFAVIRRDTALEIYSTGLNGATPQVTVAGLPAQVLYNGQPGYPGLDQVNVLIPSGVPSGPQPVVISAGGVKSNAWQLTF